MGHLEDIVESSPLVAAEVRAEMARQQKPVSELGEVLGLKDPKSARARYVGTKSYTVQEIDVIAAWLSVPRAQLLDVSPSEAVSA